MPNRFEPNHAGIATLCHSSEVRDALEAIAERVQARAAQITAAEAVDTGLMASSWRVETLLDANGWRARVHNTARDPDTGFNYPRDAIEWGYRHRSGRHIAGKRILGRALDAGRI